MLDRVWLDRVWLLLCLESMCSACRIVNSHEQTRAQFFYFFTGRTKFLQQRQSLAVSVAGRSISRNSVIVSTACTRSKRPTRGCRARLKGRATRARVRQHGTIVHRDTCHVADANNAHLTYNYFEFDIILRYLCIMYDCVLMLVDAYYAQNYGSIMYASLLSSTIHMVCYVDTYYDQNYGSIMYASLLSSTIHMVCYAIQKECNKHATAAALISTVYRALCLSLRVHHTSTLFLKVCRLVKCQGLWRFSP